MKNDKNIVLIGFMACGKTRIGKILAPKLAYRFIDTDQLVVANEQADIPFIFKDKGELYFRKAETLALKQAMGQEACLVATGGGIVTSPANKEFLNKGLVLYLKASPAQIYHNIKDDRTRPLLQGDNIYDKISSMLKDRELLYEQLADYSVEVDGKTPEEICNEILNKIK